MALRNEDRYLGNAEHDKGYDAKNMMHTIRLLQVAKEILIKGQLRIKRPNRDELLAIKAGDYQYDDLLKMAGRLMEEIESCYHSSKLPAVPDREKINGILIDIRNVLYLNLAF